MTVWPWPASACRSIARRESLSSTRRMGGSVAGRGTSEGSAQPAGRHVGAARFFFEVGDGLLGGFDLLLQPFELAKRLLPFSGKHAPLRRIVAIDEIGRQRIDPRL